MHKSRLLLTVIGICFFLAACNSDTGLLDPNTVPPALLEFRGSIEGGMTGRDFQSINNPRTAVVYRRYYTGKATDIGALPVLADSTKNVLVWEVSSTSTAFEGEFPLAFRTAVQTLPSTDETFKVTTPSGKSATLAFGCIVLFDDVNGDGKLQLATSYLDYLNEQYQMGGEPPPGTPYHQRLQELRAEYLPFITNGLADSLVRVARDCAVVYVQDDFLLAERLRFAQKYHSPADVWSGIKKGLNIARIDTMQLPNAAVSAQPGLAAIGCLDLSACPDTNVVLGSTEVAFWELFTSFLTGKFFFFETADMVAGMFPVIVPDTISRVMITVPSQFTSVISSRFQGGNFGTGDYAWNLVITPHITGWKHLPPLIRITPDTGYAFEGSPVSGMPDSPAWYLKNDTLKFIVAPVSPDVCIDGMAISKMEIAPVNVAVVPIR